jgi:hypothetical protein
MDRGKFVWPKAVESGIMGITRGQLGMLVEGIDWRSEVTPMSQTKNDSKRETFFVNY